jgi:hypothetical protein
LQTGEVGNWKFELNLGRLHAMSIRRRK